MKIRLDILLAKTGLARSRTEAVELIREGKVAVLGKTAGKPSMLVEESSEISLTSPSKYVGRGGIKLEKALEEFGIGVSGKTALDIGSSTGGFTDCLLQRGIQKVYAVDVGTAQLSEKLKLDPRVVVMENTDIRNASLPEKPDLAVIDVSFISLSKILPVVRTLLKDRGEFIALVKPQFEAGKGANKKGIVRDQLIREKTLQSIIQEAEALGFSVKGTIESPILGGDGNQEYFLYCRS